MSNIRTSSWVMAPAATIQTYPVFRAGKELQKNATTKTDITHMRADVTLMTKSCDRLDTMSHSSAADGE